MPTEPPPDDEPDHDTVYVLPEGSGERIEKLFAAWARAGRVFKIADADLDQVAAPRPRRAVRRKAPRC